MKEKTTELELIRKKLQLNQVEAAKALGISRRCYQNYEGLKSKFLLSPRYYDLVEKMKDLLFIDQNHGFLNIKQIKSLSKPIFLNFSKVECAILFGSYAKGEATEKSDVDILVVGNNLQGFELGDLLMELSATFHKKVDVLTLSSISGNIKFLSEILTTGVKIYGKKLY